MFNQEKLSPRDLELLAAAVDQMLSASEQVEFNKRLGESQHFAESYRQQQKLKQLMAQLPTRSVPHNFTLTRVEAKKAKRSAFWQPMFGWASTISAILFATIFGSELIFNNYSASPALMAKEAPSLNESVPMAAPMEGSEDLPAHVINWNYSGFDGIGGKGGAGGISDSGGVGINIFLADVPDVALEDQVEEFSLSAEGPADQISEESLEEAPEIRALPEEETEEFEMLSAAPEEELEGLSAIQDEEVTESEAIPKTAPEENVEPLEHEAPIIYGIDPEHMGEVIRESVTVHDAEFGAEVTMPEIKEVVPAGLRLGLLISAVLFGIVWLYLRFKR